MKIILIHPKHFETHNLFYRTIGFWNFLMACGTPKTLIQWLGVHSELGSIYREIVLRLADEVRLYLQ